MRRVAVGLALLLGACASLHPDSGRVRCNPDPAHACPSGYYCEASSQTCWKDGEQPAPVDLGDDGPGAPDMTVVRQKGDACTVGGVPCATGHCVDGVCCASACDHACEACNLTGSIGDCMPVPSGLPRGGRTACGSASPACAGTCNGTSNECTYPSSATHCGASCAGTCDGAGGCNGATGACADGYACDVAACRTSCGGSADCQPNFACSGSSCQRIGESDCLDGADNNGDGLADCADPTCMAVVSCVPAVATGNEIGLLVDGACSGDYAVPTPEHQGLQADCSPCGCTVATSCAATIDYFTTSGCSGAPAATTQVDTSTQCTTSASVSQPASIRINTATTLGNTCVPTTTPARPDPTWGTTRTYCGTARSSASCGSGMVCVPKPPAPLCVRIPQTGQACPGGYTAHPEGDWYGGYTDDRTCGCGTCSVTTNGTCPASRPSVLLFYSDVPSCTTNAGSSPNIGNAFASNTDGNGCLDRQTPCTPGSTIDCWGTIGALYESWGFSAGGGVCSRPGLIDSGAATPSQGSTICCQ